MPEEIQDHPIGIFDSGVGGLTLFKSIKTLLPYENLIYVGDTARLPYGTKSPRIIQGFSLQIARFLARFKIKALVVACHTASSAALPHLQKVMKVPVVGVIEPAVKRAIRMSKNKNIGIVATKTTIASNSYQLFLKKLAPSVSITAVAAPLLVPLIEEGWFQKEATRIILREYVSPLKEKKIDTLILGCTHYPLLKALFKEELTNGVGLVDASKATACHLKDILQNRFLLRINTNDPEYSFYVTDAPENFSRLAQLFLGERLKEPKLVCLEEENSGIFSP